MNASVLSLFKRGAAPVDFRVNSESLSQSSRKRLQDSSSEGSWQVT